MTKSVAELCERDGIGVKELTSRTGLDENRVMAILMGRWTPNPVERRKIADVFAVPVEAITWGHVTPIQHIYGHGPG
jgi:hypothetical protein